MEKNDNFFDNFDEGTNTKLRFYNEYLKESIPVFVNSKFNDIEIYDLFSGPGKDSNNQSGSPLILLDILIQHCETAKKHGKNIKVVFNDLNPDYAETLNESVNNHLLNCSIQNDCSKKCPFSIEVLHKNFNSLIPDITKNESENYTPKIIFIDQYGFKEVNYKIFLSIVKLKSVDLLFFISSNQAYRFGQDFCERMNFPTNIIETGNRDLTNKEIHKVYETFLDNNNIRDFYISHFSIEKESSKRIYGLIFGSKNLYGQEKFLIAAWKIDKDQGESNHNIHNDVYADPNSLFYKREDTNKFYKYKNDLKKFLHVEKNNHEIYEFTIRKTFLPRHTNDILKVWKKKGFLSVKYEVNNRRGFHIKYKSNIEVKIQYIGE